jgi:hypothetical protein
MVSTTRINILLISICYLFCVIVCSEQSLPPVELRETSDSVVMRNGYLQLRFNKKHPSIDELYADYSGSGNYSNVNIMSHGKDVNQLHRRGIVLERAQRNHGYYRVINYSASSKSAHNDLSVVVVRYTLDEAEIIIRGIPDDSNDPVFVSEWRIGIRRQDRYFTLDIVGSMTKTTDISYVRLSFLTSQQSVFGMFDRGVEQMMNNQQNSYFASNDTVYHLYTMGGSGSLGITPLKNERNVVLLASTYPTTFYSTGFQWVIAGNFPKYDTWYSGWSPETQQTTVKNGAFYTKSFRVYANNYNFPSFAAEKDSHSMDIEDKIAFYTGVYGSAVGSLASYQFNGKGLLRVGLQVPDFSYSPLYSFFDPDSYMQVAALLYSRDKYLFKQAKAVIENTMQYIRPDTGHVPHHFNKTEPLYKAISGAVQTGPNLFWIKASLLYVKETGDFKWLVEHIKDIRLALSFLQSLYNKEFNMIAPIGSLFMDTLIRNNFTTDSNAMMVQVLYDVSEAEDFLGDKQKAQGLRDMAMTITKSMNKYLRTDDHYITQRNPDGTTRDFVDYDSNLLAVAWRIADLDFARQILKRIDSNVCSHSRGTWISEKYYDKYNTFNGWEDDSAVTVARIGWLDAYARKYIGDSKTFFDVLYNPLRSDVIEYTWISERYNCEGVPSRHEYYHEYPEIALMMMREIKYGISIGFQTISIDPFLSDPFVYSTGDLNIRFSQSLIQVYIPVSLISQDSTINYKITQLHSNTKYQIDVGHTRFEKDTSSEGILEFQAKTQVDITINKVEH